MKKLWFVLSLCLQAHAADNLPAALINDMQGVYKHRFINGIITPGNAPGEADEKYQAEDIVEIVQYDAASIYVRADLQFYNGHSCEIFGIARYEQGQFVYHDPNPPPAGEPPCTLRVAVTPTKLLLTDRATPESVATCRAYCGARGSLSDYSIDRSAKRTIRYLPRLKASQEYAQAVAAFKASAKADK